MVLGDKLRTRRSVLFVNLLVKLENALSKSTSSNVLCMFFNVNVNRDTNATCNLVIGFIMILNQVTNQVLEKYSEQLNIRLQCSSCNSLAELCNKVTGD